MVRLSAAFSVALVASSINGTPLRKRIAQVISDSTTKWEAACNKAGGGEKCDPVAVAAFGTLLAAPGPCEQQGAADKMINLAKTLNNDPDMIKFAQIFAQQPRNSPNSQSVPYCQQAPKNSELNGLFQCQYKGNDPNTFVGGGVPGSKGTIPFGMSSPVSPAGSCKANPNGPIKDGSQLTDITSDPGVGGGSGASDTASTATESSASASPSGKKKGSSSAISTASTDNSLPTDPASDSNHPASSPSGDVGAIAAATATANGSLASETPSNSSSSGSGKSSKGLKGGSSSGSSAASSNSPSSTGSSADGSPSGHCSDSDGATTSSALASSPTGSGSATAVAAAAASPSSSVIRLNKPLKSSMSGKASSTAAAVAAATASPSSSVIRLNKPPKSSMLGKASSTAAAVAAATASPSSSVIRLNMPSKSSVLSKASGTTSSAASPTTILLASNVGSASATAASGAASSGGFKLRNGEDAQKLNVKFSKLTASSSCTDGEEACVSNGFAQCVGGKFQVTKCAASTICAALPLVNSPGTSIVCTTKSDADARIKATGATGGLTGSGA